MRALTLLENIQLTTQYLSERKELNNFPSLNPEEILAYQFRKIQNLVTLAYNHTEFYREKYSAVGMYPQDIKSMSDFKKLPTVSKEEIITAGDRCIVDYERNRPDLILSRSSGSSGKMLSITLDPQFFMDKAKVTHRWYHSIMDYKFYDNEVLVYTSPYPYRSMLGFYKAYYIHTLAPLDEILQFILKVQPTFIASYPSILIELINKYNDELRKVTKIKAVCTNSEHSSQEQRDFIGNFFNCQAYDEYSTEELSKCAFQCKYKDYHIQEDCSYIEILHDKTDEELPMGYVGEVTGTCLHNNIMPFIRYRQGDLGSLHVSDCPCGQRMRILNNLSGRKNHSFKLKGGREIPSGVILDWSYKLFLKYGLDIQQFQIIQETENKIEVVIVPGIQYQDAIQDEMIAKSFIEHFGHDFSVKVTKVSSIPKTPAGKHLPIKSLLK